MLSSLDIPVVVFRAESNGCIKEALLNWAQTSQQLLSSGNTQKKNQHQCFCDKAVCVPLITSQKNKSCRNDWNWRLPCYACSWKCWQPFDRTYILYLFSPHRRLTCLFNTHVCSSSNASKKCEILFSDMMGLFDWKRMKTVTCTGISTNVKQSIQLSFICSQVFFFFVFCIKTKYIL